MLKELLILTSLADSSHMDSIVHYQDSVIRIQKEVIASQSYAIEKRDAVMDAFVKSKWQQDSLRGSLADHLIESLEDKRDLEYRQTLALTWIGFITLTATILLLR